MYANPILFPEQTNREDFIKTISLFDDDTGQAIDVSGRTLVNPGDFTAAVWTVISGNVQTASASQITIKDYPFGNEMQAVPLVVGQDLAILPGDPVTIADATGLNTMTGYVTSYVPATGAMICQIGCAFDFEIRAHAHHHGDGYGPSWGVGDAGNGPAVRAQLGSGITVIDLGQLQVRIPASTIAKLHHRTYGAAMTAFDGYDTRQLFLAKLPILNGGVTMMPIVSPLSSNPYGLP